MDILWSMRSIRQDSEKHPLDYKVFPVALDVLLKAQAMGLINKPIDVFAMDWQTLQSRLKEIASAGIARSVLHDLGRWHLASTEVLNRKLRVIEELLEESAYPDKEWQAVRRFISDDLLARLLGGISEVSLRRYASGERVTPLDIATRLHFLALVIGDLSGSYDDLGVTQWFERPRRKAFNGKTPVDLLKGEWHPDEAGPTTVRDFARTLNHFVAT